MAIIPKNVIDNIRDAADAVFYISKYVQLKKTGKNLKGLCPFHQEKTPSFVVNPDLKRYHCFGCGKKGDIFTFLMEIEKISFVEAVRNIARDVGIIIPVSHDSDSDAKNIYDILYKINQVSCEFFQQTFFDKSNTVALNYIKKRKLKYETIKNFQIGFAPNSWDRFVNDKIISQYPKDKLESLGLIVKREQKEGWYSRFRNRIIFPFHSVSGKIIGFGGRRLNEDDIPKYLNSPESEIYKKGETLYGLHQAIKAIREYGMCIVVEGYFDLLRLVDSGIHNVVASSGTAMTPEQARLLKRYTDQVVIAYDSDSAGNQAAIRNSEIIENADIQVSILTIPEPHDPDSFVLEFGKQKFFDLIKDRKYPIEFTINRFKNENPSASIEEKNKFMESVLDTLLKVPNEIRVGQYLHILADKMNLSESLLISRFKSMKRKMITRSVEKSSGETQDYSPAKFKKGEWKAEEGMIFLLLNSPPAVSKYIFEHISVSDFQNEDLSRIFENLTSLWEDGEALNIQNIKPLLNENELSSLNLILVTGMAVSQKFAEDCIFRIKKWNLDQNYNEIKQRLQEEKSSKEAVNHYLKELSKIQKKISDLEKNKPRELI